jgi:hypothetical protein
MQYQLPGKCIGINVRVAFGINLDVGEFRETLLPVVPRHKFKVSFYRKLFIEQQFLYTKINVQIE